MAIGRPTRHEANKGESAGRLTQRLRTLPPTPCRLSHIARPVSIQPWTPAAGVLNSNPKGAPTHDSEERKVHGRLARLKRSSSPRRVPHRSRSRRTSGAHACHGKPPEATGSIARAVAEYQQAQKQNPNTKAALRSLVEAHGSEEGKQLTAAKVQACAARWAEFSQHTRSTYSKCLRRFLAWLEEIGQAPKGISRAVPRIHAPQYRAVVATDAERESLLAAADPALRFFLLLCSELGIRHRTAARIAISNYDRVTRSLRFTTKGNTHQTLPVTAEIAATIEGLPQTSDPNTPIVKLLHTGRAMGNNPRLLKRWWKLKAKLGIRAELRIHDLRRTVAEDIWQATKDLRQVQAQLGHRSIATTARYLHHQVQLQDLRPVLAKVQALRIARRKA